MNISTIYRLYEQGFFKVEPGLHFNPNVLVYDKQGDALERVFLESKENNRGIFVLVDTEKKDGGVPIQVGSAGVSGEDTLFNRLQTLKRPENEKWDKAILLFDWQADIEVWLKEAGDFSKEDSEKLIDVVLDSEVFQLKKFLQYGLDQAADELNFDVGQRGMAHSEIADIDSERFNYYLELVKHLIYMITEGYFKFS